MESVEHSIDLRVCACMHLHVYTVLYYNTPKVSMQHPHTRNDGATRAPYHYTQGCKIYTCVWAPSKGVLRTPYF